MQCPRCGSENAPGARACSRCGLPATQPGPPPGPPPASPHPGPPSAPPGRPAGPPPGPPGPPQGPPGPPPGPPGPPPGPPAPPQQRPAPQQPPQRPPATGPYTTTQRLATAAARRDASQPSGLVKTAIILALVAALVGLGYAGFALTLRRGVYADIDDDPTSVSKDDAESSDNINAIGLWAAGVLIGLAFLLVLASMITARRGRNGLGIGGVVLVILGAAAATWGCLLVNGVDEVTEAGDAVTGYLVAGPAFAAMAVGLILGMLGLRRPVRPGPERPAAQASFPSSPYGGGQPGQYGQPAQPPGNF